MTSANSLFTTDELQFFQANGYVICRGFTPPEVCQLMLDVVLDDVSHHREPFEFEADVKYPGSPTDRTAEGGSTIRRLKLAHSRDPVFHEFLTSTNLMSRLAQLLGPRVVCPLGHHNCVMTKQPRFSSDTGWHQDIRYWSFARPELVSTWLALGDENLHNGCLRIIPGSHRMTFRPHQFDSEKFFRADLPENQPLIAQAVPAELKRGDLLFFHALTLHAASRNYSTDTKYATVFTFRPLDNPPLPHTRSAMSGELLLPG